MKKYNIHPAALMLPGMSHKEFEELIADISANGLLQPILRKQGVIVDGVHRLRACEALGIEPTFAEFIGTDIISEIASLNLFRRHLSDDQRVTLLAKMRGQTLTDEALVRQKAHLRRGNESPRRDQSAPAPARTRELLAADARVSQRKAQQALDVVTNAPEAVDEIIAGKRRLASAIKKRRRRTPFPVGSEPGRQDVIKRLNRFLNHWPVAIHPEVKEVIRGFLIEK